MQEPGKQRPHIMEKFLESNAISLEPGDWTQSVGSCRSISLSRRAGKSLSCLCPASVEVDFWASADQFIQAAPEPPKPLSCGLKIATLKQEDVA